MKQIIPFKKELLLRTKIYEITSISLEHTLMLKKADLVSGEFHISGDYKMTEASLNREKFSFALPFEIALDGDYDEGTINIDIDNFYYEIVNDDSIQVNIDVFVDGIKIEKKAEEEVRVEKILDDKKGVGKEEEKEGRTEEKSEDFFPMDIEVAFDKSDLRMANLEEDSANKEEVEKEVRIGKKGIEVELEKEVNHIENMEIENKKEVHEKKVDSDFDNNTVIGEVNVNNIVLDDVMIGNQVGNKKVVEDIQGVEIDNSKTSHNVVNKMEEENKINIFSGDNFDTDTYVTYYVYMVKEDDTLNSIKEKFKVSEEDISNYNDVTNFKPGLKLVIPSSNE